MEKWTQSVDSATQKCGSKNDWQSRATTTHNFLYVARMAKFMLPSLPTTLQELEVLLTSKERSAIKFQD